MFRADGASSVYRLLSAAASLAICFALAAIRGEAHKPITSPYTFNEDVFPIVKERCGSCHRSGGVAPMSLMSHADAVPWGESIRAELMAGHMPPWRIDTAASRFRNVQELSGRELNVLLTWASGGTPAGNPDKAPAAAEAERGWPLGAPDLQLPSPSEVTVPAGVQEQLAEFVVPIAVNAARAIRAVDLLPGTPAIVRSATVAVRLNSGEGRSGRRLERVVALWLPGDHPTPLERGAAFELPAGSDLIVRVRYRKTWEYENRAVSDRSTLGLYFAEQPAALVEARNFAADVKPGERATLATTITDAVRLLAIYPDPESADAAVRVVAIRPDKTEDELIAFRPRAGWARRYWFREPIALPRGTRVEVRTTFDEPLLPPGALPPAPPPTANQVRLTLNVIPGT